jgi:hypothetical protein
MPAAPAIPMSRMNSRLDSDIGFMVLRLASRSQTAEETDRFMGTLKNCHPGNFSRREAKMRFPLRFIFSRLGD